MPIDNVPAALLAKRPKVPKVQPRLGGGLRVPYKELGVKSGVSSPEEACDLVSPTAKRILMVNWSDRIEAEWQIIGSCKVVTPKAEFPDTQTFRLERHTPEQHPEKPWLFATRITRSYGVGWQSRTFKTRTGKGINVFKKCVFEVEYSRPPYFIAEDSTIGELFVPANPFETGSGTGSGSAYGLGNREDDFDIPGDKAVVANGGLHWFDETRRYLEYIPESQGDYLSIPYEANKLRFTTPNPDKDGIHRYHAFAGNVGIVIPAEIVKLKWYQVPDSHLGIRNIYARFGHVNADWFYDGFNYRDPGTMLLIGLERDRVFLPHDGRFAWNVTFVFKYAPYGHNNFYDFNPTKPAFRECRLEDKNGNATGSHLYKKTYFEKMFIPTLSDTL